MLCTFCDGFHNRIRGYEELDCKRFDDVTLTVGYEKSDAGMNLMIKLNGDVLSATPVSFCPKCGAQLDENYIAKRGG